MNNILDRDWGIIQSLLIEGDTYQVLLGALTIACVQNKRASHFAESIIKETGGNMISLRPYSIGSDSSPLPFELTGPDEISQFLRLWLEK